ncbi:MAG: peptidoglycan-associated lipoprotein Pal [Geobacter sp.]|nr:peptidoglycan-associated lipoprotein Pal [Geobacter sp.]
MCYLLCGAAVAVLFMTGCAKQELIKKDNPLPASTSGEAAQVNNPASGHTAHDATVQTAGKTPYAGTVQSATGQPIDRLSASALENIYFSFDSPSISSTARAVLAQNAKLLTAKPGGMITIAGHCDERGSAEYNLALGEKRALAAQKYLISLGIPAKRLATISYGEEKPADPGHDETAWAKNRRDEFSINSN